jgi:hypothetical protein
MIAVLHLENAQNRVKEKIEETSKRDDLGQNSDAVSWVMVPTEGCRNHPYVEGVDLIVHAPKR